MRNKKMKMMIFLSISYQYWGMHSIFYRFPNLFFIKKKYYIYTKTGIDDNSILVLQFWRVWEWEETRNRQRRRGGEKMHRIAYQQQSLTLLSLSLHSACSLLKMLWLSSLIHSSFEVLLLPPHLLFLSQKVRDVHYAADMKLKQF